MKRNIEDKVAQLAFGDLSPSEAAKLEQEVHRNPEALRALTLYKDMRDGLRELSDIPEDQFSKERLRDAILTQGLCPVATRPVSNKSWLWMPAAACAMGFALMLAVNMRHRSVGPPNIVINEPKFAAFVPPIVGPTAVASNVSPASRYGPFVHPAATKRREADSSRVDPDEVDPRIITSNIVNGFEDASYDPDLGTQPASASPTGGVLSTVVKNDSASTSGPIVLIDQDKDDQTGACKATEVGSASNVLVGG